MIRTDLYPLGRKHCSKCGCWRYLHDFCASGQHLQARCKTCQRLYTREARGYKTVRDPGYCPKGHRFTPENTGINRNRAGTNRYCRTCRRESQRAYRSTPHAREYDRIYKEAQRRAAGAPSGKNELGYGSDPLARSAIQGRDERLKVDAAPFAEWLRERMPEDGTREEWCIRHHIDGSQARRLRDGVQKSIHIDTVDRVLMEEGSTFLFELYPALYEDEAVAA